MGRVVRLVVDDVQHGTTISGSFMISEREVKDYNRARAYLRDLASRHNVPVYSTVEDAIKAIIEDKEDQKQ